jgi:hypothetical protein
MSVQRVRRELSNHEQLAPTPKWTLPAARQVNPDRASVDRVLGQNLRESMLGGYSVVQVPEGSSLDSALDIYRHLLADSALQAWFKSKGMAPQTLTLHKDSVSGYAYREGVRTPVTFSTSDDSGWWQVSAKLRAIRDVLDPADTGIDYLAEGEGWVSHALVLQAYGLPLPASMEARAQLLTQLGGTGLGMPGEQHQHLNARVQ